MRALRHGVLSAAVAAVLLAEHRFFHVEVRQAGRVLIHHAEHLSRSADEDVPLGMLRSPTVGDAGRSLPLTESESGSTV